MWRCFCVWPEFFKGGEIVGELTSKQFWADTGVRAIRTMAQTAVGVISAGAVMSDVDWLQVASASALAGLVSVLMSLDRIGTTQTEIKKESDTQ